MMLGLLKVVFPGKQVLRWRLLCGTSNKVNACESEAEAAGLDRGSC